ILPFIFMLILQIQNPNISTEQLSESWVFTIANALLSAVVLILPFTFVWKTCKAPFKVVFPVSSKDIKLIIPACAVGLGVSVIGGFISALLSAFFSIFGTTPIMGDFSIPTNAAAAVIFIIELVVIVPITEEFVFRGVIMGVLRQFGDYFAIGVSALLFALLHRNMVQFPNAFIMGLILGYFVIRTGSIWTGIIIHGVNNAVAIGITALMTIFTEHNMALSLSVYGLMLSAGLIGFFYFWIRQESKIVFKDRAVSLTVRQKLFSFFTAPMQVTAVILMVLSILSNFTSI
ncbi:MAG: type II CAAX endopeptidase family protein, partial [Oscillospiraceae bacterium]